MKPVDQDQVGVDNPRANCLMAAVASIVECDLGTLPDVYEHEERGLAWWGVLVEALRPHGFVPVAYDAANPALFPPIAPPGYHIGVGKSPRSEQDHAVVLLDGQLVHDPHPSRAGLSGDVRWWILLLPARSTA